MAHVDDDDLVLLALGERIDDAEALGHLASCPRCATRLDELSATARAARAVTPDDALIAPPASVWSSIERELGAELRPQRRRAWVPVAVAAAVGLVIGGTVVGVAREASGPAPQVIASGTLDPIGSSSLSGTAAIEEVEGARVLRVSVPGLQPADGYYEVWMATADTTTMVALGTIVPGRDAVIPLPADLDPAQFPVVDVSHEHFDGDPSHSAESVVRGTVPTASA